MVKNAKNGYHVDVSSVIAPRHRSSCFLTTFSQLVASTGRSLVLSTTLFTCLFIMALRQILSKTIMPSLEADLTKIMSKEVAAIDNMLGPTLPTQVFGYEKAAVRGAFAGSAPRSAPRVERVNYPAPAKGLFQ